MKISEDEIRKITLSAISELGDNATPELVKTVVDRTLNKLDAENPDAQFVSESSGRVILTSFGKNTPGIVAAITSALAEMNCDLQDMSQKIMGDFFTLIMIVDISESDNDLSGIQSRMASIQNKLNIKIYMQHEDIFKTMHRV